MGASKKNNENKHFMLFPTDESKDTLKKMKNCGTKSEILLDQ